jgi:transcriptional regulator with XRE-family HTH domain
MFITTQKKLAEAVGIHEVHLSNILSSKVRAGFSESLGERLAEVTGIRAILWATERRQTVKRLLREFFYAQKKLKRINAEKEQ